MAQASLPSDILKAVESLKGGPGSGNHGHGGLPGVHGGSSPKGENNVLEFVDAVEAMGKHIEKNTGLIFSTENDFAVRSHMKSSIVRSLSHMSGIPEGDVNRHIGEWAKTSNKSPNAYRFQKAVSEELGIPLSPWQKEKFKFYEAMENEYNDIVGEFAEICLEKFEKQDFSRTALAEIVKKFNAEKTKYIEEKYGAKINIVADVFGDTLIFSVLNENKLSEFGAGVQQNILFPFKSKQHLQALRWFLGANEERPNVPDNFHVTLPHLRRMREMENKQVKEITKAVYDNTQWALKKIFPSVTHVTLYRGVTLHGPDKYKQNAIEAWSLNPTVAKSFARGSDNVSRDEGNYFEAVVPIKNIFSTCLTGMGCLSEYEFIVTPGDYKINLRRFGL